MACRIELGRSKVQRHIRPEIAACRPRRPMDPPANAHPPLPTDTRGKTPSRQAEHLFGETVTTPAGLGVFGDTSRPAEPSESPPRRVPSLKATEPIKDKFYHPTVGRRHREHEYLSLAGNPRRIHDSLCWESRDTSYKEKDFSGGQEKHTGREMGSWIELE